MTLLGLGLAQQQSMSVLVVGGWQELSSWGGCMKTGRHHGCSGSGSPEVSIYRNVLSVWGRWCRAGLAVQKKTLLSPTEASERPGIKAEGLGPAPPPPSRLGCHSLAFPAGCKRDPRHPPRPCEPLQGPCSSTLERGRGLSAKFQLNPQALII